MASGNKPHVHINDRLRHYPALKAQLGGGVKFDRLNKHIGNVMVMPGELIVVGDESTLKVSTEESELMRLAFGVHYELLQNHATGDGQFIKNYDVIQNILNYGSLGIGASTGGWSKHLDGVQNTLENIERHYQLMLRRGTPIARQEFINQRRALFAKLDTQLKGIAHWGTGLHNQGSIKKMLGLSTKSYLHTRELRGYAERVGQIAKASKFLKYGTPVGVVLNTTAAGLEIREACSTGREDMCTKAKYVEGAKLVGSVSTGYVAGLLGAEAGMGACAVVFGIPTGGMGVIGCGIVFGAVAAYGGGMFGETSGENVGEVLYEWRP
jgi:hypothetical protein